jgi:hypothetical protein
MWSNDSSSAVELRPASPWLPRALAGLALAAVAAVLALSAVPPGPAAASLLLAAGGLGRAACRRPVAKTLRSPLPGQWCVVPGEGPPQPVRLLRAWCLGGWLAAARFASPGGGRITVTLLCRDQAPEAWRRFLVRLRTTSGS